MDGLFARRLVRCSQCGAVLRECDEYCPDCLSERVSTRVLHVGKFAFKALGPIALAVLVVLVFWIQGKIRQAREDEEWARRGPGSSQPSQPAPDPFDKWIHTPKR